jgi:hypothetical protein
MALENFPEECHVLIADRVADLLHRAVVALEQTLGGGDTEFLQIDERAVSSGLLEAADEVPKAHPTAPRQGVKQEGPVKVLVEPFLRLGDGVVGVIGF